MSKEEKLNVILDYLEDLYKDFQNMQLPKDTLDSLNVLIDNIELDLREMQ